MHSGGSLGEGRCGDKVPLSGARTGGEERGEEDMGDWGVIKAICWDTGDGLRDGPSSSSPVVPASQHNWPTVPPIPPPSYSIPYLSDLDPTPSRRRYPARPDARAAAMVSWNDGETSDESELYDVTPPPPPPFSVLARFRMCDFPFRYKRCSTYCLFAWMCSSPT